MTAPRTKRPPKPAPAIDPSLVFRWIITCDIPKLGWAKRKATVAKLAHAVASTKSWQHLPGLAVGLGAAAPYAGVAELAKAIGSGASRVAVVQGGKNQRSSDTTGGIEVEIAPGAATLTAALGGPTLAALRTSALDDFFATAVALRVALPDELHVVVAHAWCDWADEPDEPDDQARWPLRAIADVFEPDRPPWDEDDEFLEASKLMAKAKPPAGVERSTSDGLVALRWTSDPCDLAAVEAASAKHIDWILKTAPAK
ncbi:MAG TPA: hypothetical protein PLR99_23115 [Polyangiaceae bacterium]|nr:hypothetical protein [Polyangiaceae bacterium]